MYSPDILFTPAAKCSRCDSDICEYELFHFIDGFNICAECFEDFAFDYFSANLILGKDLVEIEDERFGDRVQGECGAPEGQDRRAE